MASAFSCIPPNSKLPLFSSKFSKKTTTQCLPLLKITMLNQHQHQDQASSWASVLTSEINTHILKSLPTSPPPSVKVPMHLLVSAAPPSVAPALCIAACELVGGQKAHAFNAACAIHLIHAAAHSHSQLLLNPTRSSMPIAPGIQLMTGDGILPLGYELAARADHDVHSERVLRVIIEMARATGPQGAVEGQLLEAEGTGEAEWVWERKAGRMSACGAACGAILGGGSEEEVEKMRRFGWYVGIMKEMMICSENASSINREAATVKAFRSLARLELQGFEEGKVEMLYNCFLESAG